MSDTNNPGSGSPQGPNLQIIVNTLQNIVIAFNALTTTISGAAATFWTSLWTAIWSLLAEKTIPYAASVTLNLATGFNFGITLTGNVTFANPAGAMPGQSGSLYLTQGGSGSYTASWGTSWQFAGGTAPTLTTTVGHVDRLDYKVRTATNISIIPTLDVRA